MSIPLVIDTDTAADDCFALLAGLLHPNADLRAITLVAGNVSFDKQVHNAFVTIGQAGRAGEVPIFAGARQPMMREWASAEYVHGDGKGGVDWPVPDIQLETQHGVDALIDLSHQFAGELVIVAIGPLTNIATAVVKDRDFAARVSRLYVMGGSNNYRGNITPAAEYNFYVDPEAAKIVADAGFDLTIIDWGVTLRQAVFTRAMLKEIADLNTPLAHFFVTVNKPTLEFDESVGINGSTHPDILSVFAAIEPALITRTARYRLDIECAGETTRGYSVFDWGVFDQPANATVVEEIDETGFYHAIKTLLQTNVEGH